MDICNGRMRPVKQISPVNDYIGFVRDDILNALTEAAIAVSHALIEPGGGMRSAPSRVPKVGIGKEGYFIRHQLSLDFQCPTWLSIGRLAVLMGLREQ